MSLKPDERRQVAALSAYLKTIPAKVLNQVLLDLGAPVEAVATPGKKLRVCQTCGLVYPRCRSVWGDDHDFEPPS